MKPSPFIRMLLLIAIVSAVLSIQLHLVHGNETKGRMLGGRVGHSPPSPSGNPVRNPIPPGERPSPPPKTSWRLIDP
ncbi:hypothetical protein COCNU_scaffold002907G000010 [Cocos nucifera]|nr:hypothetical protein [Cocos nucifera]